MQSSGELKGPRFELSICEDAYPSILRETPDPPLRLYGIGNPEALVPGVGVVGARKATPYGLECTRLLAEHVALRGVTIVSGGARGCDQAAHRAAVEAECPTVVVFGSAPDMVYPKSGRPLFQRIIDQGGAIISEQKWGTAPLRGMFPRRNRIIAGLSALLLIAEAGLPSGTFSTADAALAAGREVAVVPGSILSPYSKGTNYLITQGADPIVDMSALDQALESALARFPLSMLAPSGEEESILIDAQGDALLQALVAEAYSPAELTSYFGYSTSELSKRLSQYELAGMVERGSDGRYRAVRSKPKA